MRKWRDVDIRTVQRRGDAWRVSHVKNKRTNVCCVCEKYFNFIRNKSCFIFHTATIPLILLQKKKKKKKRSAISSKRSPNCVKKLFHFTVSFFLTVPRLVNILSRCKEKAKRNRAFACARYTHLPCAMSRTRTNRYFNDISRSLPNNEHRYDQISVFIFLVCFTCAHFQTRNTNLINRYLYCTSNEISGGVCYFVFVSD